MLSIGYFSHTSISISETFIYDLLKKINSRADINLTYVSGQRNPVTVDFNLKSISVGYSTGYNSLIQIAYKIGQIKSKGPKIEMQLRKWSAFRSLERNHLPEFDCAYVDYATSAVLLMDYFERMKIPFVVHVHGYDITAYTNNMAYVVELEKLFKKASAFIAASQYMKRRLILLGCSEKKIKVIRLGLESESIKPTSWEKRKKGKPSVVFIGRLTEKKHPIALLHAFKIVKEAVPSAVLTIIGGGKWEDKVKNEIERLHLKASVKMMGSIGRNESFPILNKQWIYAQHSVTSIDGDTEGFALSLAEAALHELPVVSTIHNGITENVVDGETGFLVPEYDYESMAEKIIYLIKNPDIAEMMGKVGRKHITQMCNINRRSEEIIQLLLTIKKENKIKA